MRFLTLVWILLAGFAVSATTDGVAGTWRTTMVVSQSTHIPLVRYEPFLQFQVKGRVLTGIARMDNWPGDAPISEGKADGNRVSFTLVHEMSYTTNKGAFYPAFRCEGTIHGNEMDLIMDSVDEPGRKYTMKGTKVSQ